jgi:hypothetical protein
MRLFQRLTATVSLALLIGAMAATGAAAAGPTYVVQLTGAGGGDPDGSGTAVIRLDDRAGQVCYVITVRNIGLPTEPAPGLGAAHIHDVATGGIFVDLETSWVGMKDAFTTTGCVDATADQLAALTTNPSAYYVNIHTVEFPGGALRGDLG